MPSAKEEDIYHNLKTNSKNTKELHDKILNMKDFPHYEDVYSGVKQLFDKETNNGIIEIYLPKEGEYFWNYEYRHDMRDIFPPAGATLIAEDMLKADLELDGSSNQHREKIEDGYKQYGIYNPLESFNIDKHLNFRTGDQRKQKVLIESVLKNLSSFEHDLELAEQVKEKMQKLIFVSDITGKTYYGDKTYFYNHHDDSTQLYIGEALVQEISGCLDSDEVDEYFDDYYPNAKLDVFNEIEIFAPLYDSIEYDQKLRIITLDNSANLSNPKTFSISEKSFTETDFFLEKLLENNPSLQSVNPNTTSVEDYIQNYQNNESEGSLNLK